MADDPHWPLKLDGEGRYIQGPDKGKAAWLEERGARRRRMPRKFPLPEGCGQLVAVVDRGPWDAALWVQDEIDYERCRQAHEREVVVWLEIPSDWLFQTAPKSAERPPASCEGCRWWSDRVAGADGGGPVTAMCLHESGPFRGKMVHEGCSVFEGGQPVDRRR